MASAASIASTISSLRHLRLLKSSSPSPSTTKIMPRISQPPRLTRPISLPPPILPPPPHQQWQPLKLRISGKAFSNTNVLSFLLTFHDLNIFLLESFVKVFLYIGKWKGFLVKIENIKTPRRSQTRDQSRGGSHQTRGQCRGHQTWSWRMSSTTTTSLTLSLRSGSIKRRYWNTGGSFVALDIQYRYFLFIVLS